LCFVGGNLSKMGEHRDLNGDTKCLPEVGVKGVADDARSKLIVADIQNAVGIARAQSYVA
jgi:hypothetical protein